MDQQDRPMNSVVRAQIARRDRDARMASAIGTLFRVLGRLIVGGRIARPFPARATQSPLA
jgi:hypothetical protein